MTLDASAACMGTYIVLAVFRKRVARLCLGIAERQPGAL